jgi:hypothetical protein
MYGKKPQPIGAVTVATAGTRVRLTSTLSDPTADVRTPWIFVQAAEANTGIIYVGVSDVANNKYIVALGAGEGMELTPTQIRGTECEYFLNDFYIDASSNAQSVQVTYDKDRV